MEEDIGSQRAKEGRGRKEKKKRKKESDTRAAERGWIDLFLGMASNLFAARR